VNIPSSIWTLLAGIALTVISLWYGQNSGLLPDAVSEEAVQVDSLFRAMLTVSVGLVLLVQGIVVYSAIRFRRRKGDESDGPHIEGNIPLEILWTAIPTVIVFGIGIYSFNIYSEMGGLNSMDSAIAEESPTAQVAYVADAETATDVLAPLLDGQEAAQASRPKAKKQLALGIGASPTRTGQSADVIVDVMGLQYAWIFTYPDSGVVAGELHIPVGKEVQLNIQAQDVLHAFWMPELRLKQDAIPGRTTELRFVANKTGTYPVICAELCGPYHGAMNTKAFLESEEDYDAWVQSQIASQDTNRAIAAATRTVTAPTSDSDRLAPIATAMGFETDLSQDLSQVSPVANSTNSTNSMGDSDADVDANADANAINAESDLKEMMEHLPSD
jgi:cytochrome c oxidase subunit 2